MRGGQTTRVCVVFPPCHARAPEGVGVCLPADPPGYRGENAARHGSWMDGSANEGGTPIRSIRRGREPILFRYPDARTHSVRRQAVALPTPLHSRPISPISSSEHIWVVVSWTHVRTHAGPGILQPRLLGLGRDEKVPWQQLAIEMCPDVLGLPCVGMPALRRPLGPAHRCHGAG